MHYFAPDKNYWGGHGIVGGQTPLGLGLAYGLKYKGLKGAALCFLGRRRGEPGLLLREPQHGGAFRASCRLRHREQQILDGHQPRAFVGRRPVPRAARRGVLHRVGSGQRRGRLRGARRRRKQAIERAHNESKPTVIEFDTYRYYGHSVADAKHKGGYRQEEEIEQLQEAARPDPALQEAAWSPKKVLSEEQYEAIDAEAQGRGTTPPRTSPQDSPIPTVESIFEDVYFEVDRQTEAGRTGRFFFND